MNEAIEAAAREIANETVGNVMYVSEIAAILRKHFAEPAERADQWLPIASAPKDGTPILLRDGSIVGSGQYGRTEPWSMRKLDGFYFDGASLPSCATHWMRLPSPPELDIKAGDAKITGPGAETPDP